MTEKEKEYYALACDVVKEDAKRYNEFYKMPYISIEIGELGFVDWEDEVRHDRGKTVGFMTCISLDHDPYFKALIYDETVDTYSKMCRIYWDRPEYVTGVNSDIRLTREQIDELIEILNQYGKQSIQYFNMVVDWYNEEPFYNRIKKIDETKPIPNYYKLLEEV